MCYAPRTTFYVFLLKQFPHFALSVCSHNFLGWGDMSPCLFRWHRWRSPSDSRAFFDDPTEFVARSYTTASSLVIRILPCILWSRGSWILLMLVESWWYFGSCLLPKWSYGYMAMLSMLNMSSEFEIHMEHLLIFLPELALLSFESESSKAPYSLPVAWRKSYLSRSLFLGGGPL